MPRGACLLLGPCMCQGRLAVRLLTRCILQLDKENNRRTAYHRCLPHDTHVHAHVRVC